MFVGRDRELAALDAALSRAEASSGGVVLLTGEPGIGKTRLATEAARVARERGARVAWGRCWEAGGAPAFWPWREALEALGIAFPDASAILASDAAEARFALFREVTAALGREAARGPLVIVLEDLHAADRSTLLLLELVSGALRSTAATVIGTYRELEASLLPDTGDALARAGRLGEVLHLSPLREPEVALLVRGAIEDADDAVAASVWDTTRGHPLFVDEVVRAVRASGPGAPLPIPLGVREIIRQRLAGVSGDARRALEAAAVLGVELAAPAARRMAGDAALDDAMRSGLLGAQGDRLRFAHALYREALYADLPRERRQALHRDAARALATAGAPLSEIAHHLLEGGPDAVVDGIEHAVRAAELALDVYAFEDAVALLERARAAIPPGPLEARLRCRVAVTLGEARVRAGDPTGRALCAEAARAARELGDATLLSLAGLAYGAVFITGAVDPVLVGILEDALALLPGEDSALRARVMARLAGARQPDPAGIPRDVRVSLDAIAMARRVEERERREDAGRGDARRELLAVLHAASGSLYGAVEPSIRLPISREQERLAEELGDRARLLAARSRIAMDLLELADFDAYARATAAYEELTTRIGRDAGPWRALLMRSMSALALDRFEESERWQEEARLAEPDHPRAVRARGFHRIGFLRGAERLAELRASVPLERSLWNEMPIGGMLAEPHAASSLARAGADDEVRAILEGLPDAAFENQVSAAWLAEALWASPDPRRAPPLLALLERSAERWSYYWIDCEIVEAPTTRLLAYLAAILGDWERADREHADAIRRVEAVGRRSMLARMRFEYADLMLRLGRDPDRARALLDEARAGAAHVPELLALIDRRHPRAGASSARPAFAMALEGEYYAVTSHRGTLRFKANLGMRYLAHLVERPGREVHVLELAGAAEGVDAGDAGEQIDRPALRAYRARLEALRDEASDAEERGDVDGAERARSEMEALASELVRGGGRGGRARRAGSAVERARSAVRRRIKDALDRIAESDPELGRWLERAVRTGTTCSYRPEG